MLPGWNPQNNAGCVFDQLCTASGHNRSLDCASPQGTTAMASKYRNSTREATCLEHHVLDGKWVARPSKPYPMLLVTMLLVTITPSPQDHVSFGVPMRETSRLTSVTMSMVADTGCQSTIIHLKSTYAMGIRKQDPIPVRLAMRGAMKEDLEVMAGRSRHRHLAPSDQRGSSVMSQTRWR